VSLKLHLQTNQRRLVFGADQDSGGSLIDSMDDSRPLLPAD
jgi:hypothetical protein